LSERYKIWQQESTPPSLRVSSRVPAEVLAPETILKKAHKKTPHSRNRKKNNKTSFQSNLLTY